MIGGPLSAASQANDPLAGLPLRYLIGLDGDPKGEDGVITMCGYDVERLPRSGISAKYCNLLDETNSGAFGPYLRSSGTAAEYGEGLIDPRGPGFVANLTQQFSRARSQGFRYVEIDNADSYKIADVLRAVDLAFNHGLRVFAKNPGLLDVGQERFVSHANVCGIIVEKGAGTPAEMDRLRRDSGRPQLPVWFVSFGSGKAWAAKIAPDARGLGMRVSYATKGEYGNAVEVA